MGLEKMENGSSPENSRKRPRRRPKMKKAPPPPCVAGEKTNGTIPNLSTHEVMAHHPGDDCAINELLEGNMDLEVVLPDSKIVRMTVERRIPMMDLLVQVTKANKISPGGHFISLSASNKDSLHYKPNTPIGSLDTNTIYIMSKSAMNDQPATKMLRSQSQPFEKTFRLQVNLPKKQLMVIRVSPKTTLAEIKKMICTEKKLEYSQYYLVHPSQPTCLVDLNYSLSEYGCTEISIISKTNMNASISNSTSDLIGYPISISEDEKKKKKLLNIFKRKSKSVNNMMLAGEAFKDTASSRGVSPARSDICDTHSLRAKRQSTKKRAPPPPPPLSPSPPPPPPPPPSEHQTPQTEREIVIKNNCSPELSQTMSNTVGSTTIITTMVSHSRQSSDSSGYHEASVLSDSPDNLSPETSSGSGSSGIHSTDNTEQETQKTVISKCNSRLKTRDKPNFNSVAHSMLILSTNKKRKAPPPPPLLSQSGLNKENIKSENEANSFSSERENTSNYEKDSDLPSETVPEVKPVMIEIVNDALIQESTVPENVIPLNKKNIDSNSHKLPSENGIESSTVEQSDISPLSSPVCSSPSQVNISTEPETLDSNNQKLEVSDTSNHCHTEEETGEVIHFPEKDQSSEEKSEQQKSISTFHNMNTFESNLSTEIINIEENNSDELIIDPIKDEDADKEIYLNPVEKPAEEEPLETSDPEWDFNIPEPPSPFRNNIDYSKTFEPELTIQVESDEIQPVVANYNNSLGIDKLKETSDITNSEDLNSLQNASVDSNVINNSPPSLPETLPPRDHCYSVGSTSSDIPPPLPISDPPESSRDKSDSFCSISSVVSFPEFDPSVREFNDFNPVDNEFNNKHKNEISDGNKIKNDDKFISISKINITNQDSKIDISNNQDPKIDISNNQDSKASITNNQVSSQTYITVPQPKRRPHLENFTIGSYTNGKVNTDLTDTSHFFISSAEIDKTSKNLIRTNSNVNEDSKESNKIIKPNYNFTIIPFKCRNSSKEVNEVELNQHKESSELSYPKEIVKIEPEKVQSFKATENIKLEQYQLEEEYQKLQNQLLAWQQQLVKNQTLLQEKQIVPEMSVPDLSPLCSQPKVEEKSNVYRSQTLPRLKPNLNKDSTEQINYSTVEYHSQPKSHILKNVTIGSWEQKPEVNLGLVAEVKPRFQNMNISQVNNHNVLEKTKMSNTLLEDNEKSKLSRISAKFDIKPAYNNKNIETNRTSENLEDAPPAVILAQIRKEMKANAKYPTGSVLNTESQKENSLSKTYVRPKSQVTYSHYSSASDDRISHLTKLSTQNPIKVSENMNKPIVVATIKSKSTLESDIVNGDSNVSLPMSPSVSIPPPLPPIVPINKNNSKFPSATNKLKVSRTEPQSDPREELMIEIRNFGGRRALRKVPLNQAGWHLKVFGTLSSSSV